MKHLNKESCSTSFAAAAGLALLAIGLSPTAKADTNLLAVEFGAVGQPTQSGWSAASWATNTTFSQTFGAYTVSVPSNVATRNRGVNPSAVNAAWTNIVTDNINLNGNVTFTIGGLTSGTQYYVNIYNPREANNTGADVHFKMSTTGINVSAIDCGWSRQHHDLVADWAPTASTGITLAAKGDGWCKTPVFTATSSGTITLWAAEFTANSTGDTGTGGTSYAINAFELYEVVAPVTADAGVDKTVTPSAPSVQIGGSTVAIGGTAPYTYLWSPSGSLNDATLANPTATLSAPGTTTYTLTVTDALSATSSDTMTVTWPALAADAGADKSLTPSASSAVLGGSPSAIGGTPSYTYKWTPGTGLSSDSVANPIASPAVTTIYTLEITDSALVVASDTVTVNYPLAANAGPDRSLSPLTTSAQIGGSPTACGGAGPFTYSWSPSTDLSSDTVANPTANPTTTTTYTVTVTDTSTSATVQDSVTVTYTVPNPNLVSVDFMQSGGTTCVGDTTLTGTTMKNAVNNTFTGQLGNWNALNIGTYNVNSAISGFLTNGGGVATTVKLALGRATGLDNTTAGGWRCNPNEGALGGANQLRAESAYLYYPTMTVDHYAWAVTGLAQNSTYRLTLFGTTGGTSNIANYSVAGTQDSEGDWNWETITSDETGRITGNFLATGGTPGLYGLQIDGVMPLLPALVANAGADQTYTDTPVTIGGSPTTASLWGQSAHRDK